MRLAGVKTRIAARGHGGAVKDGAVTPFFRVRGFRLLSAYPVLRPPMFSNGRGGAWGS